jgi:diguanylate cyclase (GGDEF)-like protein/PAS domain S-box-containing protein
MIDQHRNQSGKPRILIVDDAGENLHSMVNILSGIYASTVATSGPKALELAVKKPLPNLILLDVNMLGMDGYEVLHALKSNPITVNIPVIIVTDLPESDDEAKGFRVGASDFITKPVDADKLKLRVLTQLELRRFHRKPILPSSGDVSSRQKRFGILVVDDVPDNIHQLISTLSDDYRIMVADNGARAIELVHGLTPPDLIMLDILMPNMDGYEVCRRIKATEVGNHIPIIFVSTLDSSLEKVRGFSIGAADFISRPFDVDEVRARVRNHLDLSQLHRFFEQTVVQRTLALQQSESRLSEALKIARVGYWEYEFSSDEFFFNDQYYALHQITSHEAGGYRMASADFARRYVHPEDVLGVGDSIQHAFASIDPNYSAMFEARMLTGKGEVFWVDMRFKLERNGDGEVIKLQGISQDISKRMQAQLLAHESDERFKTMFVQAPLGIALIDSISGNYCDVNPRFAEIVNRSMEEMLQLTWMEITHPNDLKVDLDKMELLNTGEVNTFQAEKRYVCPDHTSVWVNLTISSLTGDSGSQPRHLSMIEDITARKLVESRVKYLNRVYAVLSEVNSLIIRVNRLDELFREACRIAVNSGEFRMAMFCTFDSDTQKIIPVASEGKDESLLSRIKHLLASCENTSQNIFYTAIREKRAIVSNDSLIDPKVLFGQKYAESDVRSMAVLPLIIANKAVGAMAIYSVETEFFHAEEMKLLTELANDISFAIDHIAKQEKLNYLAYYDELTGLANRSLFSERVAQYIRSSVRSGHKLALCLFDLERFKSINDSLGRLAGDELLRLAADWLSDYSQDVNLLARIDADHFAIVLPEISQDGPSAYLIEKMGRAFNEHRFRLNNTDFRITTKVGIAVFPDDGSDADTLFKNAEVALKKAKVGGDPYLFYTQKMNAAVAEKLTLENQLRKAIDNEEFVLYYQPKVDIVSGKVNCAEALIRWNDPITGLVPPGKFIPVLEETGLIYEVGRWALNQAIADNLRWRKAGLPAIRVAVNVSALQLHRPSFIGEIEEAISVDAHAAEGLELEITESMIMNNIEHNITSLEAIRAMGITVAIDDFGTGFSSLSYLSKLPVDTLKIDRSFVIEMTAGPEGLALVSTIITLAHAFKLNVIAEGVETEEQSNLLRGLGCDQIQGFLYSKAVPHKEFETTFLLPGSE